ncbi:SDR family NAD(P)-dependent oxidoreductase [Peribacillus sp. SCS-37]|uniref:SDR family NAD(P)-dependent oxidoreductase n=1 Tax=Paraperibacillus esterisolvens TaxID=3115296 RepID=UPI003906088A
MEMTGKTAIVTGAGNGIGKEVALQFGRKGVNVIIADIDPAGAGTEEEIIKSGGRARFILTDVRKEEDILKMLGDVMEEFNSIDYVINNAGVSEFKPLLELTTEEWDNVIQINLRSTFILSREAARRMKKGGRIVNISSTRTSMSEPGSEAYASSKGGITALTHALAASLSPLGITVNSISPGWIQTENYDKLREKDHEQHFSNRVGKPSDIARACLFLCHPENDFITAEDIVIDGGMTRKMIYRE